MPRRNSRNNNNGARNGNGRNRDGDVPMQNSGNGGTQVRNQPTCNNCGQTGHRARACPSPAKCTHCKRTGHTAQNCFHNPANQQNNGNQNNNQNNQTRQNNSQNKQNNIQNGDNRIGAANSTKQGTTTVPMAGYAFADVVPTYTGSEPYCPNCNNTTHHQGSCPYPDAFGTLHYSKQTCQRCGYRGHTRDECKHPAPSTHTNKCGICHRAGHIADECPDEVQKRLHTATSAPGTSRFTWNNAGQFNINLHPTQAAAQRYREQLAQQEADGFMMTPEREAETRRQMWRESLINFGNQGQYGSAHTPHIPMQAAPPFTTPPLRHAVPRPLGTPFQTPHQRANNVPNFFTTPRPNAGPFHARPQVPQGTVDVNRREALRAHAHRSATLYTKEDYSRKIYLYKSEILSRGWLSEATAWHVSAKIAQGVRFWRDPHAMEAIIMGKKAVCWQCDHIGKFLDGNMCGVGGDLLKLKDDRDWGIFIMFDCKCCGQGFSYKHEHEM